MRARVCIVVAAAALAVGAAPAAMADPVVGSEPPAATAKVLDRGGAAPERIKDLSKSDRRQVRALKRMIDGVSRPKRTVIAPRRYTVECETEYSLGSTNQGNFLGYITVDAWRLCGWNQGMYVSLFMFYNGQPWNFNSMSIPAWNYFVSMGY